MSQHAHRFLIVRLGALGDVVHAIPVVAALRERYPASRIEWLVDPRYAPLLGVVRGIDRILTIDARANPLSLRRIVRDLRRQRYSASLDLQGLLKSAVLARLAGGLQTVGFSRGHLREPLARLFYSAHVEPGPSPHVIRKNLSLLRPLGIRSERIVFPIDMPPSPAADAISEAYGARGFAVLNAAAAWPNKRWPVERYGALARQVRDRVGLPSVIVWGPGEDAQAARVAAASDGAAALAPPTTVLDVLALAARARVVVSGDTGPLHLATAAGTPAVGLFGPTRPERNGPWDAADVCVSRHERCGCHYQRRCRRSIRCIDDIDVTEVADAVERRVAASPSDLRHS